MALTRYLAMTAAEIEAEPALPPKIGWMACHFSPYGRGLSNIPGKLPEDSLLLVNDRTPIRGHDPVRVAEELREAIGQFRCAGVLLDFQRPGVRETFDMAHHLCGALPCPVAVSHHYADASQGAVCVPCPPLHEPVDRYFARWQGRELWVEMSMERECIALTPRGASIREGCEGDAQSFADEVLCCHYSFRLEEDKALFSLWRTQEDLDKLLTREEELGIRICVGLYQELWK